MLQDLRYAIRALARRPLVTTVAVLSLALGIGVNTAIFSAFDRLLLKRLPIPSPDRIVFVTSPGPKPGSRSTSNSGRIDAIFSYPLFRDLEQLTNIGIRMAAHRDIGANIAYRGQTSKARGSLVSGQYFPVLGVTPALGRLFGPADDRVPGGHPIVVLSYDYWNARFGADPRVLHESLVVNGELMIIVGVAPRGFVGTTLVDRPDFYIPLAMAAQAYRTPTWNGLTSRVNHWLYVFGRLDNGVSRERAQALSSVAFTGLIRDVEFPAVTGALREAERKPFQDRTLIFQDGSRLRSRDRDVIWTMLLLLQGVTIFVLCIACANVANLLLARITDATQEMAIRLSLGAAPGRVTRLLLLEVLTLGLMGSAGALVVGRATLNGLQTLLPPEDVPMLTFSIDGTVLAFTLALGVGTTLLFGLFPTLHGVRAAVARGLHGHTRRATGSRGANRFRTSMAATQVALATALLAVAGLFIVSLVNVSRIELGIQREGLVTFGLAPIQNGYTSDQSRALFARLEDDLRALPGVTSVTATTVPILTGDGSSNRLTVEGFDAEPEADTSASYGRTSTDYFRTLGVPLIAGRDFTNADTIDTPAVAIVNEAFARKFNLGSRTIGARFRLGNRPPDVQIVGLVRDTKYSGVRDPVPAQFFLPYRQSDVAFLTFYVKGGHDTRALAGLIPPLVARLDANLPIDNFRTMDDQIWENTTRERILTTMSSAFAGLAVVLAAIGLYAVLAFGVAQRLREFGIRIALGARNADVHWLVLSQVGRISLIGGAIGASLAFAIGRLGQAMLYEVQGYSLSIVGGAVLLVLTVVVLAAIVPARRAIRVQPVEVLRAD
jgi:putative ABC transport system permease protein